MTRALGSIGISLVAYFVGDAAGHGNYETAAYAFLFWCACWCAGRIVSIKVRYESNR